MNDNRNPLYVLERLDQCLRGIAGEPRTYEARLFKARNILMVYHGHEPVFDWQTIEAEELENRNQRRRHGNAE